MFEIKKTLEVSASHKLCLDYESPCQELHGHNWIITVYCRGEKLNQNGMLLDFTQIKKLIHGQIDHKNLNEVLPFNPTAENIAAWVVSELLEYGCYKAEVEESANNTATYTI